MFSWEEDVTIEIEPLEEFEPETKPLEVEEDFTGSGEAEADYGWDYVPDYSWEEEVEVELEPIELYYEEPTTVEGDFEAEWGWADFVPDYVCIGSSAGISSLSCAG